MLRRCSISAVISTLVPRTTDSPSKSVEADGRWSVYRFVCPRTNGMIVRQVWPQAGHEVCEATGKAVWIYDGHRFMEE